MSWFNWGKRTSGPDYSAVTSREAAALLVEKNELVPMLLLPELFGGEAHPANVVFVPPFAAEIKMSTDQNVIRPLAESGKVTRYNAKPTYAGKSFVPVAVTIQAHEPGDFTQTIQIWGEGASK